MFISSVSFIQRYNRQIRTPFHRLLSVGIHHHPIDDIDILAFDFDGVICASAKETALTALRTSSSLWSIPPCPQQANSADSFTIMTNVVEDVLLGVRPIVETGYEMVLLSRYVQERYAHESPSFHEIER
eukprot:gene9425-10412_t